METILMNALLVMTFIMVTLTIMGLILAIGLVVYGLVERILSGLVKLVILLVNAIQNRLTAGTK